MWKGIIHISTLTALVLLGVGCKTPQNLKPLPEPEQYNVPPPGDQRFTGPPNYPDNVLNENIRNQKTAPFQQGRGGAPRGGGMGPGGIGGGLR